jgi:hypothetical protein
MPARFVILHHRFDDSEHWDLMIEHGEVLLTWQLLREPVDAARLPIPARRIGDHRKAYLEYEGPVSGGRGTVRRVDAGTVEIEEQTRDQLRFRLAGSRLCGSFVLQRGEAQDWTLANLPVP